MFPHVRPLAASATLLLLATTGPGGVWLGLRVRLPECDPGAARSVAALVVPPATGASALAWLESLRTRPSSP